MRVPIRARITAAFAVVMLVLLTAVGVLAYVSMSRALLDEIDTGLRFRAESVAGAISNTGSLAPDPRLQEPTEAFEQILTRRGAVVRSTSGFGTALLTAAELAGVTGPTFFERRVPHVADLARLLALPVRAATGPTVIVVGASMSDRSDALHELAGVLLVGGPVAIALACLAAWVVAGWALRPMERIRAQAAAITASGLDHRLTEPRARDELQALSRTLNDMLGRLARSLASERAFLERASHELRTPLTAMRTEVDLALSRRRTADELGAALRSVSHETDRLIRLADDLLILARAQDDHLPLRREQADVRALLDSAVALFSAAAQDRGIRVTVTGGSSADIDPLRIRQVLVNLLDNALRHTPAGGTVHLSTSIEDRCVHVRVADSGAGFTDPLPALTGAGLATTRPDGTGLGLRIVHAVVVSHGGTVTLGRSESGGALVDIALPVPGSQHQLEDRGEADGDDHRAQDGR